MGSSNLKEKTFKTPRNHVLLLRTTPTLCYGANVSLLSPKTSKMSSWPSLELSRVPRHFGILDQLLEEAEKRVIAEQRQHQSMKEYFSAIESMAKAMMVENAQSGPKSDQTGPKSDQAGPKSEDARPESDQSGSNSANQRQHLSMKDYLSAIESMVNAVLVEKEQSEEKSDQFEKKIEITKPETENSVKKQVAKRFGSKVNINETMDKVEIIIELIGHKFNAEHLDVQVIDGNVLLVKAE